MEQTLYSVQPSAKPSDLNPLNSRESICRNCHSGGLEALFHFPETFFWYGVENLVLEKNIAPLYSDAIIFFCKACGFMGSPVNESLRSQLNYYYQSPFSVPGATPGQDSKYSHSLANSFFSSYSRLLPGVIPEKVLEVGCQRGYLLNEFRARGAKKVVGVEPGQVEAWVDESGYTVEVRRGLLSKDLIEENDFDLVYSLQVLEHIENPNEFLKIIYDSLKVGGKLFLAVPNELFSLKEGNVGMFLFQHLNYFSSDILQSLLENNGFEVAGIISERDKDLMVVAKKIAVKKRSKLNPDAINNIRNLLKSYKAKVVEKLNFVRELSDREKGQTLGFYGVAGISNIFSWIPELKEKGVAVFDSDSATWGKQFGGVPCLVRPPEELDAVENVIPAPFRLHDEILRFLESKKGEQLKVHRFY